LLRYVVRKK